MKGNQFEYILGNLSFTFLLLSMLFYWFQASFESSDSIGSDGAISLLPVDPSKQCFRKGELLASLQSMSTSLTEKLIPSVSRAKHAQPGGGSWKETAGLIDGCVNSVDKDAVGTNEKSNRKVFFRKLPSLAMWSANLALASMLLIRWLESGHFPLSNLYESLLFLSWSFTTIHFFLERAFYQEKMGTPALGAVTSPIALFTNAFATFSLPQEMQKSTVLVPALQSNWLMMHVSVMMVSYAALLSGSLLAMAFLVIQVVNKMSTTNRHAVQNTSSEIKSSNPLFNFFQNKLTFWGGKPLFGNGGAQQIDGVDGVFANPPFDIPSGQPQDVVGGGSIHCADEVSHVNRVGSINNADKNKISTELGQTLDNLSYRSIGLGFALLTVGILSGAVWANEAWGSYWSWDPKETWAFVTWLTFAFYLHTRLSRGWAGKKSAFVATFGFLIVWFCYLGVNLFGKGLHSYGWFS